MLKTILLTHEDDVSKTFSYDAVDSLVSGVIGRSIKQKVVPDIMQKTMRTNMFFFRNGDIELKRCNEVYAIDFVQESTDLILPKAPSIHDWVLLHYGPTIIAKSISNQSHQNPRIKISGNGERIMGYDEPLICDVAFSSLRFIYLDKSNGWAIS